MFGGGLMNIKAVISNGLAYGKAIRTHKMNQSTIYILLIILRNVSL